MLSPQETNRIFRVLDANKNRLVEGLRSVEEFARFVLSDAELSSLVKDFRHLVGRTCSPHADQWLLQRDSDDDVGEKIEADGEYSRPDIQSVVIANLSRASESIRALEEYGKTIDPELARSFESIRYRFYELEKRVKRRLGGESSLGNRHVYVLTSACESEDLFRKRILLLVENGADLIQLREKNVADRDLLSRAKIASEICRKKKVLFLVNDRPDIAVLSNADGVHVGQDELPIRDVRLLIPNTMLVGVSTHSLDQAKRAIEEGADYIGVGPTFASHTKCFKEFTGPELLRKVSVATSHPAFAIGGINLENLNQVIDAGFQRVAVSHAVHRADEPTLALRTFKSRLASRQDDAS